MQMCCRVVDKQALQTWKRSHTLTKLRAKVFLPCPWKVVDWPELFSTSTITTTPKKAQLNQIWDALDTTLGPVNQKGPTDLRPIIFITHGVDQLITVSVYIGHQLLNWGPTNKTVSVVGPEKTGTIFCSRLYRSPSKWAQNGNHSLLSINARNHQLLAFLDRFLWWGERTNQKRVSK